MLFGQEGYVKTYTGPAPKDAKVSVGDGSIFRQVNRITGGDIPKGFPARYTEGLQEVELFNPSTVYKTDDLVNWQKQHSQVVRDEPLRVFSDYIASGFVIQTMLIRHPTTPNLLRFAACSVVLQRGVIVYNNGVEDLFLKSYIHSAEQPNLHHAVALSQTQRRQGDFANFVPRGGIHIGSFKSDTIWFPLSTTELIEEPASYVVLDFLTQAPLDAKQLPEPFHVDKTGKTTYKGSVYYVSRVTAKLPRQKTADLNLKSR